MKKLKFESNGSTWLLLCANNRDDYYLNTRVIDTPNGRVGNGVSLCMITEEQASEVVDEIEYHPISSKDQLLFLLKSKGVYLYENPYQSDWDELCTWGHGDFSQGGKSSFELYTEAEANTYRNPVLFKIINDEN